MVWQSTLKIVLSFPVAHSSWDTSFAKILSYRVLNVAAEVSKIWSVNNSEVKEKKGLTGR